MNRTNPAFEPPVTKQEMDSLITAPVASGGCCSSAKPTEQAKDIQSRTAKSSCCCQ